MAKIEQINNESHKNLKIKKTPDVSDLAEQNILPVVVGEFSHAATEFPICFIKNPQNDEFQVVVLMGIERKENLFVENDQWTGSYMPARYTHKPFGLVSNPNNDQEFGLAMDVEHPLVSETEGEALFNEDGTESEFLEKQKKGMSNYLEQEHLTKLFAKELGEKELLIHRQINVKLDGKQMDIDGVYMVDEEKFNQLSDEDFLSMRKRGMLSAIYTHLLSMRQMNNLMRRKSERMAKEKA
ncbi:MAG: SapC family protein [Aestuariibacter sp.]